MYTVFEETFRNIEGLSVSKLSDLCWKKLSLREDDSN